MDVNSISKATLDFIFRDEALVARSIILAMEEGNREVLEFYFQECRKRAIDIPAIMQIELDRQNRLYRALRSRTIVFRGGEIHSPFQVK